MRHPRMLVVSGAAVAALFVLAVVGAAADSFAVRLVSQTSSTITLGWVPQPGYGYLFSVDGRLVSRTNDPGRSTVRFAKGAAVYEVAVIVKGATGTYPTAPPPPPPTACSDGIDNDGDGHIDYPQDAGCTSSTDTDETDPAPPPPSAACVNGVDDDQDGKVDYPADPGCLSVTDTDETDAAVTGVIVLSVSGDDSTCGRGNGVACRTFQRAYEVAQPGDTVSVRAGTYPSNNAGRDAVTVFGNPNSGAPVTFACAGDGDVAMSGGWFTIKAFHVRVVGDCFHLTSLRIGEPGDSVVTASDVTVDSVHMQGFEAVGAQQVVLRNSEIGPNVYCYAQSANVSASAKCDPNGPGFESMWATRGTGDYPFQPYVHNNKGGVATSIVMDGNYVHDLQTKDATALHTGCGLVWQSGDFPVGQVTIRNSRFERCAVLGILFESANGVLVENNWMGPPVEPLSNANGGQEAGSFAKEIIAGSGYDKVRNWRVVGNTLCHGTRSASPAQDVVFDSNDLGLADARWSGATYTSNRNVGASC